MPKQLDTESSQTHVFLRRNIVEKTREDEHGGEPQTYYEYEEVQLTKLEYQQLVNEQLKAENVQLKTLVGEQSDAMVELAGLLDDLNIKNDEVTAALMELAALIG